jgi:hypothetical protein
MRSVLLGAVLALIGSAALAQGSHYVQGYVRQDGTYVAPHYQTNPNGTTSDNYSTKGNVNPYTGQAGTKPDTNPYGYVSPYSYQTPQQQPQRQQPQQQQQNPYSYSPPVFTPNFGPKLF